MSRGFTNLGKLIGGVITGLTSGVFTNNDVTSLKRSPFTGGNKNVNSIYDLVIEMSQFLTSNVINSSSSPGTLTVNSVPLGNYEYSLWSSPVTISSGWTNTSYFSTTKDTLSSFVIINGNLTIDSGQTFTPPDRKLFLCLYVKGSVTVNGTLSMTARGANHSNTGNSGGLTNEGNILIFPGSTPDHTNGGTVTNFTISATGGAGASPQTSNTPSQPSCSLRIVSGTPGPSSGPTAGSGGGGAGAVANPSGSTSGGGSPGTCFTGGTGGGGSNGSVTATSGSPRGGAGGTAPGGGNNNQCGGAGNPGGPGPSGTGGTGTGGTLILIATGPISGSGTIESNGANGGGFGTFPTAGGGGSGGGCIVLMSPTSASTSTITANGGSGDPAYSGCGGNGSIRRLGL